MPAENTGSFDVTVTGEALRQACDNYCAVHGAQLRRIRFRTLERIVNRRRQGLNAGMISFVVLLNVATLTASIVFFSQSEITGGYFWGALFLLIFLTLMSIVFDKQVRGYLVRLQNRRLRTETEMTRRSADRMFETYHGQTPYTVTYHLDQEAWSSDSEPGGHKSVDLNSDLYVLHNRSSYLLYEFEFSYHVQFVIMAETDEQRALIETGLAAHEIPCCHIDEFNLELNKFAE